jgi:hypothetical protein
MSDELNEMVGDLLGQLQTAEKKAIEASKERDLLKKEDLETFVVENAGKLVSESLDMIKNVKEYIISAPEHKDVSALADLVAATSSAIETLNKIVIADKRNETFLKTKEMDIKSRQEKQEADTGPKKLLSREDIFKMLIDDKIVDAKVITDKQ